MSFFEASSYLLVFACGFDKFVRKLLRAKLIRKGTADYTKLYDDKSD